MAKKKRPPTLADQLRAFIQNSGVSLRGLAFAAQVDASCLTRFMAGERDLTVSSAGRLADVMGLQLVQTLEDSILPAAQDLADVE
jgi:plasmid maintenance system antidote protein VapI